MSPLMKVEKTGAGDRVAASAQGIGFAIPIGVAASITAAARADTA